MSPGAVARSEHYTHRRRALLGALSCLLAFTGTPAASAPPGARGDAKLSLLSQKLGEQAAQITMRILQAQAHLLDLQEALGDPAVTPAGMELRGARPGSYSNLDEMLAAVEPEVGALEKLLDSGRGPPPGSGLAIADGWSNSALLQHPGDRGLFQNKPTTVLRSSGLPTHCGSSACGPARSPTTSDCRHRLRRRRPSR